MIKLLNLKRQFYLLVLFLSVTSTLIAQNSNEKQKLQGKWILENSSIQKVEGNDSVKVDIARLKNTDFDISIHVLPKLEFYGDSLNVIFSNSQFVGQIYIDGTQIRYYALPMPIDFNFSIRKNELILHKLYTSQNGSVFDILLTYKKD